MQQQTQIAVFGVTGYAGAELARLLLGHPRLAGAPPLFLGREGSARESLTVIHPQLAGLARDQICVEPFSWELLAARGVKVLFLATPHEQSRKWAPEALSRGLRIVDLSGAWRLEDSANRAVYKFSDEGTATAAKTQSESVYGMPEMHRDGIAKARLVANPGCYATTIILALKPLLAAGWVDVQRGIICDAKSGVSGAGKEPTAKTHFMHAADNLSAYGLFGHRHTGELLEQLNVRADDITFTPHLLPIPRGILATIYVTFREKHTAEEVEACLRGFYTESPMVRIHPAGQLPQIQHVVRTNFCDLGFQLAPDGRRAIVISCLDNLLKGAAGQAVQNLNVMNGWQETEGLL
ncbi:MAG TPA: N-acetyl-gamma-glutamyl-phosphate reductase [Acidobacteriaceae bacterium]|nr:N-acetyl-gamma-glutamyl-phosphate reductase [Acidobacteriaceae bacterium]